MNTSSLREDLVKLKYPNVENMTPLEFNAIFTKENRQFFIKWLIYILGDYYSLPSDQNQLETKLADIIYRYGYCSASQKLKFVKGDLSLSDDEVFGIFFRMLKYARPDELPAEYDEISNSSIFDFCSRKINLFPDSGPIQHTSVMDSETNLLKYQDGINKVRLEVKSLETEIRDENQLNSSQVSAPTTVTVNLISDLEKNYENFKQKAQHLTEHMLHDEREFRFSEDFSQIVQDCSKKISNIANIYQNVSDISKFCAISTEDNRNNSVDPQLADNLKKFANLTEEIKKY